MRPRIRQCSRPSGKRVIFPGGASTRRGRWVGTVVPDGCAMPDGGVLVWVMVLTRCF